MTTPHLETSGARHTLTLALGTFASRVLGFLRDMLVAWLLGPFSDIFLVAFRLPNFLRRVLAEGSLGIAQASSFAAEQGCAKESPLPGRVFSLTVLAALALALLLSAAAALVVFALAPGLPSESGKEAARLFRFCLPYVPLCAASMTLGSLLMAKERFFAPAFAPCLLSLGMIATPLAVLFFQSGTDISQPELAALLCLGLVLGGFLQAGGLALALRPLTKAGQSLFKNFWANARNGFRDPEARGILKATPVALLGASAHHLHILAAMFMASFLAPGGISSLYFAERLLELPLGLAGAAVGMAALPRLAALAGKDRGPELADAVGGFVRFSAFFSLPAATGLMTLAPYLVRLLFGHAFDTANQAHMAGALAAYALGLPAMCASRPLLQALAVLQDRRSPLWAAGASFALMILCAISGMRLWGATGIALALSLGAWGHVLILWLALRYRHELRPTGNSLLRPLTLYCAASLVLGLGLLSLPALPAATLPLALALAGVITGAVTLWIGLFLILRTPEALTLGALFTKKAAR